MKNTKRISVIVVLVGVFCGTFALAQTAKTVVKTPAELFRAKAEAATSKTLSNLIYYYKPSDAQKAKLKEVLVAQYKDRADYTKVYAPKIKALDDEIAAVNEKIAALKKEIVAIEKRKAAHAAVRDELRLDHRAEINGVLTQELRMARLSRSIKGNAIISSHFAVLPKTDQDSLKAKCDAAALELLTAGKDSDSSALYAASRTIRAEANKVLTPELRQTGDRDYLMGATMRKFVRIKLTDTQKATIRDLCDKAAKRKAEVYAQYAKVGKDRVALDKDRSALRRTISQMSTSAYYYTIRDEAIQSVLTDEQLKAGGFKRKTRKP
jgi:hypothetical protein